MVGKDDDFIMTGVPDGKTIIIFGVIFIVVSLFVFKALFGIGIILLIVGGVMSLKPVDWNKNKKGKTKKIK